MVVLLERSADGWNEQIVESGAAIPSRVLPGLPGRVDVLWTDASGNDD